MACTRKTIKQYADGSTLCGFVNDDTGALVESGPCYSLPNSPPTTGCESAEKIYPAPGGIQKKCLDDKTVAAWNQIYNKYDSAVCSTGKCENSACVLPEIAPYGSVPPCKGDYVDNGEGGCKIKSATAEKPGTDTSSTCPRGESYIDWLRIGPCDTGYEGNIWTGSCDCKKSTTASASNPLAALDPLAAIGKITDMLPTLIMGALIIAVMGMFKK